MSGLRYAEVSQKEQKFLDVTSLTVEEFDQLVPAFEEAFQERMKQGCLDGKKRSGRPYRTYANCPLPTPQDRLLFILFYVKTNVLQVVQGQVFAMPQNKANQWIHTLLPVLQVALRSQGDAKAALDGAIGRAIGTEPCPAFASGARSSQPRQSPPFCHDGTQRRIQRRHPMQINKKAILAARKNATR